MTYREAVRLKPGSRIEIRDTGQNMDITGIDHDAAARQIIVTCDNGRRYGHRELNPPCIRAGISHHMDQNERLRMLWRFSSKDRPDTDNGTWFVFANGDMEYIYKPQPHQISAMETDKRVFVVSFPA